MLCSDASHLPIHLTPRDSGIPEKYGFQYEVDAVNQAISASGGFVECIRVRPGEGSAIKSSKSNGGLDTHYLRQIDGSGFIDSLYQQEQ